MRPALAAVVGLFLLFPPPANPGTELLRLEKSADAMGSTYSIAVYGSDRVRMEAAIDAAFDEVRRLDDLLSNYKPASEWSEVNRDAAQKPVKVSAELFQLLRDCVEYSRQSEGAFDISVGPLMKVWGFYKGTGHLPHRPEVAAAMAKVGYRYLQLDPANRTVRFLRPGMELDPGGIGKGYAVDRMVDVLRRNAVTIALVAGSGSSIYGMGAPPDGPKGWAVQIKDPWDQKKTVAEVWLKDMSLSTSGSYEKFFRAEGKVYAHIMDPRTGYPAQGTVSVSVLAPRTLDSEAWAKPYFVNGRQWAAKHRPKDFRVFFCEDRMEKPCAWLQ
ncbi:MAG TPA: FAD:protein FMN transferase [Candidatus Acidoferrum sp.]|nr:FAD:protein FMN transferase [Candidatus Acidoferrum sp.]